MEWEPGITADSIPGISPVAVEIVAAPFAEDWSFAAARRLTLAEGTVPSSAASLVSSCNEVTTVASPVSAFATAAVDAEGSGDERAAAGAGFAWFDSPA